MRKVEKKPAAIRLLEVGTIRRLTPTEHYGFLRSRRDADADSAIEEKKRAAAVVEALKTEGSGEDPHALKHVSFYSFLSI